MSETDTSGAMAFVPAHGRMFVSGWPIIASVGNGDYALTLHARGPALRL